MVGGLARGGEVLGDRFDRLVRDCGTDPAALRATVNTLVAALHDLVEE